MARNGSLVGRIGVRIAALQRMTLDWLNPPRKIEAIREWRHRETNVRPGPRESGLDEAIRRAQGLLQRQQHPLGYWSGELLADSTLQSDYLFLRHFLDERDPETDRLLLNGILRTQNEDGGWSIFEGGPSELNATVKAYIAMRLCDLPPETDPVRRARERILALGGIEACNSYARVYLSILGALAWRQLPSLVPELMLVPKWAPFNIYWISSWSRGIVVPLMIIFAAKPRKPYRGLTFGEIRTGKRPRNTRRGFLTALFRWADRALAFYDRIPNRSMRRASIAKAAEWMKERMRPPGGLGAIYPAMLNSIIALRCLGYDKESPELRKAWREMREFEVREGDVMRVVPCFSPVWDTAWSALALAESHHDLRSAAMQSAISWLLSKQADHPGDWQVNNKGVPSGGWFFEFDNPVYPDVDDTAAVLMALHQCGADRAEPGRSAFRRGLEWMLAMQNDDGGWGAFDRNNNKMWLNSVPFADHNALLDPSEADITARIVEVLGRIGFDKEREVVRNAVRFVKAQQCPDGSWYGRWGVNYIYGTWQVIRGLVAVGEDPRQDYIQRGVEWLRSVQREDGGWGETCATYVDLSKKGAGRSTPSQTAWAVSGLLAAAPLGAEDPAVRRGKEYLLRTQRRDGGWDEEAHTGTGFPGVFYLKYTMYRQYFPLITLSQLREASR